jgi:hypothetical protein
MRASVLAQVAGGVAIGGAAAAGATKLSVPMTSLFGIAAKGVAVVAVVGAGAAAMHHYESKPPPAPVVAPSPVRAPAKIAHPIVPVTHLPDAPPVRSASVTPSSDVPAHAAPPASAPAPVDPPAQGAESKPPVVEPAPSVPSVAADLVRLRDAQSALERGDLDRVLSVTAPISDDSPFARERDGLRAIAHCTRAKQSNDPSVKALAERETRRFLSQHAGGSLGARVERACSE